MLWLDFKLFGNGHGIAMPYFDGRLYWLSGRFYTWIGGHGAQLQSFQWLHPRPGERRTLAGREYRAFQSERKGPRVRVSWALTRMPSEIDRANWLLRQIRDRELGKTLPFLRDAPASVDTHPQGGDSAQTEAPFMSGAVPSEETADAQTPSPTGDDNV